MYFFEIYMPLKGEVEIQKRPDVIVESFGIEKYFMSIKRSVLSWWHKNDQTGEIDKGTPPPGWKE